MKATLTFNLNSEGDRYEYKAATHGVNALRVIHDTLEELRKFRRHGGGEFAKWFDDNGVDHEGHGPTLEQVGQFIRDLMEDLEVPHEL
jgi:hypothetical protein